MNYLKVTSLVLLVAFTFVGCGGDGSHSDLKLYISTVMKTPAGKIDPIPVYPPYESYIYSAASMRSPFDRPIDIKRRVFARTNSDLKPDLNRTKEVLEGFDLNGLSMVGSLDWDGAKYALIKDRSGMVHRVLPSNYIGKNHGKVVEVEATKIELIEIVSDGLDGWVERPRVLALVEKD
ncbi:MAG: type IV pilus assembly protein PilP [Flavobacteriales bacterium]|jgi:type IV pilus assembly protein PilP